MGNISKGFTIIEVLIAIFVLTTGIVAVLYMFPISLQVENYSQRVSTALQLAQEKIEEEVSKSYENVFVGTTTETQLSTPFENYSRQTVVNYVDSNHNATTTDTGLKKLEVKVTFETPLLLEKNVEIISLMAKR